MNTNNNPELSVEEMELYEELKQKDRDEQIKKVVAGTIEEKTRNFGRRGRFNDGEFWVSLDGTRRHLMELTDDHLLNLSTMLEGKKDNPRLKKLIMLDHKHILTDEEQKFFDLPLEYVLHEVRRSEINKGVKEEIGRRWTEKRVKGEI